MTSPKVSVLMPLYNTPIDDLKISIESILNQSFTDFEFLILNDSPDNKKLDKVVKSYKDSRIVYLKNEENLGLEESTNKLINHSSGEYIAIFDHDDISLPKRLEKEAEYLDKHPKVGVVSAQFKVFGQQSWTSNNPIDDKEIKEDLAIKSCVSHTSIMIRKSVLEKNNIRYEKKFFPAASYRIITQLALVTKVHNLPDVLLEYRMDGNNTSIKHAKKRAEARAKIQDEYSEKYNKNQLIKKFKFDKIEELDSSRHLDERRYYKTFKDGEVFFVKSSYHSFSNEYNMAKEMFEKNKEHFIEPIAYEDGRVNYLVMRWSDGIDLDKYLAKKPKLTKEQKEKFANDLLKISNTLWNGEVVHRDIMPRNFRVQNDKLILIDLYFAVKYDNYQEYDYINDRIMAIGFLGETYALGRFKWDDMYSIVEVAKHFLGDDFAKNNSAIKKIVERKGKRVITPDPEIFYNNLAKRGEDLNEHMEYYQKHIEDYQKYIDELNELINARTQETQKILKSKSYKIGRVLASPFQVMKNLIKKILKR